MDARAFRMHATWRLPYPSSAVFDALADADTYPTWWPQVREATRVDAESGSARLRSLLPLSLRIELHRSRQDASAGLLRADIRGDLVGWCQWVVRADGGHTNVAFDQRVLLMKSVPAVALWALRPVLYANHRHMMRAGQRGLVRYLGD
ncbi:SRPBCC family protein [Gordonia sinesedis]